MNFGYVTENGVNSNRFLHIIIRTIREEEYHEAESQRTGKINASYGRKSCKSFIKFELQKEDSVMVGVI